MNTDKKYTAKDWKDGLIKDHKGAVVTGQMEWDEAVKVGDLKAEAFHEAVRQGVDVLFKSTMLTVKQADEPVQYLQSVISEIDTELEGKNKILKKIHSGQADITGIDAAMYKRIMQGEKMFRGDLSSVNELYRYKCRYKLKQRLEKELSKRGRKKPVEKKQYTAEEQKTYFKYADWQADRLIERFNDKLDQGLNEISKEDLLQMEIKEVDSRMQQYFSYIEEANTGWIDEYIIDYLNKEEHPPPLKNYSQFDAVKEYKYIKKLKSQITAISNSEGIDNKHNISALEIAKKIKAGTKSKDKTYSESDIAFALDVYKKSNKKQDSDIVREIQEEPNCPPVLKRDFDTVYKACNRWFKHVPKAGDEQL